MLKPKLLNHVCSMCFFQSFVFIGLFYAIDFDRYDPGEHLEAQKS